MGQTGCTVLEQCKEHGRYILLGKPEKSAVSEHCGKEDHQPQLSLREGDNYYVKVICKAMEISLEHMAVNCDVGLLLSLG